MTKFDLAGYDLILPAIKAAAWIAVGAFIGAFHFLTLRWNVRMLTIGQSFRSALAAQLARFAVAAGALAVVARYSGALPLLAATAGILAARTAVLRIGVQP